LRYQFPFMEMGRRTPDAPATAHATVRAAAAEAARKFPGLLLLAGKSFGGRMTTQAQANILIGQDGWCLISIRRRTLPLNRSSRQPMKSAND
jgi:predicted alpha/beta-hydrolase family hydrolase